MVSLKLAVQLSFKTLSLSSSESLLIPLRTSRFLPSRVDVYDQEEAVSDRRSDADFSPDLKLFVGNLPFNVDSGNLAELFGQAGNVEVIEVIYDKLTGRSRGFGFLTMSTVQEVEAACAGKGLQMRMEWWFVLRLLFCCDVLVAA